MHDDDLVGDLGVEPSCPEGRQIYSLLQSPMLLITQVFVLLLVSRRACTLGFPTPPKCKWQRESTLWWGGVDSNHRHVAFSQKT